MNDFLQELAKGCFSLIAKSEHGKKPRKLVTAQPKLRKTVRPRKCLLCGTEFTPELINTKRDKFRRSEAKCCSPECSKALRELRRPMTYKHRAVRNGLITRAGH
jgi:hypothetical protein